MTKKYISFLFIVVVFLMPSLTYAYIPYNHTATALTKDSGLYTISVNLGHSKKDMYVPIVTQRTDVLDTTAQTIGFTFTTSEEGNIQAGNAQALLLSNAKIVDNMYFIPAGSGHTFTIVTLLSLTDGDPRAKYGLQITNLPFTIGGDENGLTIHELGNYQTKEIGLSN